MSEKECIVKGCRNPLSLVGPLCRPCYVMLSRGVVMESKAWFVMEMEFMHTQNHFAMEQVRELHDKVNELSEK